MTFEQCRPPFPPPPRHLSILTSTLRPFLSFRRQIRIIEDNAKWRHLKNLTWKGTLRQVVICLRPGPPFPPLHTVYTCIQYTYSHREGGRGEELNKREGERRNRRECRSQSWVENTKISECTQEIGYFQSVNSYKHLPQSLLTGKFFSWWHFALTSVSLIFLCFIRSIPPTITLGGGGGLCGTFLFFYILSSNNLLEQ